MLAVPALALLIAQPGSPCTDDPSRPAAVHLCRADQHLAAYRPDIRGNPENDRHLLDASEDLMQATTAARGTVDFGVTALRLVRLFAPDRLNDPDKAVPVLQHVIEADPANLEARFTLAAVLEAEREFEQARELLEQTRAAFPDNRAAASQLAAFTHRAAARLWDDVSQAPELDPRTRMALLEEAARGASRALTIDPDLEEALLTKEQIVRALADGQTDGNKRAALLAEADELRARAARQRPPESLASLARRSSPGEDSPRAGAEWRRPASRSYRGSGGAPVLSSEGAAAAPGADQSSRGEEVAAARRVKYVPPVYPEDAIQMGVEGAVVIEVAIDEQGKVVDAKVLTSVPLLDRAALDAVRQWEYTPTMKDGKAIPVRATVTVGFSLK